MGNWSKKLEDKVNVGRGTLRKLMPKGVWHFHYKNDRGEWTTKSTQHKDKGGAVEWAEAFSLKLTRTDWGIAEPQPVKADDRIEPALKEWLEYQRTQNSFCTHRSYSSIVAMFKEFLATKPALKRLRDVTTEVMFQFRQWALDQGNKKVTVDNKLIALRSFFSWCTGNHRIAANPVAQQRHGARLFFDEESPRKDTYTDKEFGAILDQAGADRPVFELLGNTGLRCRELAMLEWTDIDRAANVLKVRRKVTADGVQYLPKDKTDRAVPISPVAWSALTKLAGDDNPVGYVVRLRKVKDRADYFERHFLGQLKDLSKATTISEGKLTLHNFRRFFVSHCADVGIPMATVMDWVGHDDMAMVMHYYRLRDESAQRAMERFGTGLSSGTAGSPPAATTPTGSKVGESGDGQTDPTPAAAKGSKDSELPQESEVIAQRSTTTNGLEHLGSGHEKTAFPKRKRGGTERVGFEPTVQTSRTQPFQGCSFSHSDTSPERLGPGGPALFSLKYSMSR